jgi:hypothetical protein
LVIRRTRKRRKRRKRKRKRVNSGIYIVGEERMETPN